MLKHLLSTAAIVALMAGPAYAQSDQAGAGAASSADPATKIESQATAGTGSQSPDASTTVTTGTPSADGASDSSSTMETSTTMSAAGGATDTFVMAQDEGQWRAEKLIGATVKNSQDERIGKISDLVIGQDGQLQAAVVSVGGFLGIGAKSVALSWDQLQVRSSEAGEEIMASLSKEELENAPDFKTLEDRRSEEAAAGAGMPQGTAPSPGMGTN